jgi:transcriptional regulator with XRE-family HTH domain
MLCRAEISKILVGCTTTPGAIEQLLIFKKATQKSYSAANLARRANISRSYLSEVISGKKKLTKSAANSIRNALGLVYLEAGYFDALFLKDSAKTAAESENAQRELNLCLKMLQSVNQENEVPEGATLLSFDIYASVSLFGKRGATLADFKSLFRSEIGLELQAALQWLVSKQVLVVNEGRYSYSKLGLVFSASEGRLREDFWRASIQESLKNIGKFKDSESFFSSYAVSVETNRGPEILAQFKKLIFERLTEFDSPQADGLMRLNIQMYPTVQISKRS